MIRSGMGARIWIASLALPVFGSSLVFAQGQALPDIKVNLPPSPNFNNATAPVQHPTGELSVYGLRKGMSKYLDKDVRVKGFIVEVYECPAELRKCNDDSSAKGKKEKAAPPKKGAPPAAAALPPGGCRPCEQPHFFVADNANIKKERALLVADYPVKDWETGKPKPLTSKAGDPVVVTGTFAINSVTGFAASNGLIIHKRLQDGEGKILAEGNAVLPPDAQTIQLDGKPPEPLKLPQKK